MSLSVTNFLHTDEEVSLEASAIDNKIIIRIGLEAEVIIFCRVPESFNKFCCEYGINTED